MTRLDLMSFDAVVRDYFPQPGERLKQYVVDERREHGWAMATCPSVPVDAHLDNTGAECGYETRWIDLFHAHCCSTCGAIADKTQGLPAIAEWRAERDARPKPCADRALLSDEIVPPLELSKTPMLAFLRRP